MKRPEDYLVVTRFPGFHRWCESAGIVPPGTPRVDGVEREFSKGQITGKIVVGPLPVHLLILAKAVIHIPVPRPPVRRLHPMTEQDCETYALPATVYRAQRIANPEAPSLPECAQAALEELKKLNASEKITKPLEAAILGIKTEDVGRAA